MSELSWLVARDDAQRSRQVSLWVDPDLHKRQAPHGWVQVRTAGETIALLDEFPVHSLSFNAPAEATVVVRWLHEQDAESRDCWPRVQICFHGQYDSRAIDQLIAAIEHHSSSPAA